MNRRAFLSTLAATFGAGVISATLDSERLLWLPGQKTVFIPPPAKMFSADAAFTTDDLILSMEEFYTRFIEPHVAFEIRRFEDSLSGSI